MNEEIKAKWLEALRSGEYKQGCGALHDELVGWYCCLGVLCEVAGLEKDDCAFGYDGNYEHGVLPSGFGESIGIVFDQQDPRVLTDDGEEVCLSELNDEGMSFSKIADLIEKQL